MPVGFQTGVDMTNAALNRMRSGGGGGGSKMSKREKKLMDEQIKKLRQDRENEAADREEAARKRKLLEPNELDALERKEAKSAIKGKIQENRKQGLLNREKKLSIKNDREKYRANKAAGVFDAEALKDAQTARTETRLQEIKRDQANRTELSRDRWQYEDNKVRQELELGDANIDLIIAETDGINADTALKKEDLKTRDAQNKASIDNKIALTAHQRVLTQEKLAEIGEKKRTAENVAKARKLFDDGISDIGLLMSLAKDSSDPESAVREIQNYVDSLTSSASILGDVEARKLEEFTKVQIPDLLGRIRASAEYKEKQIAENREQTISVLRNAAFADKRFKQQYESWSPEMQREWDITSYVRKKVNATGNVHMNQLMNNPATKGLFIKYKLHNDPNKRWAIDAKGNHMKTTDANGNLVVVPNLIIDEQETLAALEQTLTQYAAMGKLPRSERMDTKGGQEQFEPARGGAIIGGDPNAQPAPARKQKMASDSSTVKTEGTPHPWGEQAWMDYRAAAAAPSQAAELLSSMRSGAAEHDLYLAQQGALEGLSSADQALLAQMTAGLTPPASAFVPHPAGPPPAHGVQPPAGQPQPPAGQPPAGQPPAGQPPTGQPPAGQPPTAPTQPQAQLPVPQRMSNVTIAGTGGKKTRQFNATAMHTALSSRAGGNQQLAAEIIEFMGGDAGMNLDEAKTTDEAIKVAKKFAEHQVSGPDRELAKLTKLPDRMKSPLAPNYKDYGLKGAISKAFFGTWEAGGFDIDVPALEAKLKGSITAGASSLNDKEYKNLWDTDPKYWPREKIILPMLDGEEDRSEKITWDKAKVDKLKRQIEAWKKWKAFKDKIDTIK